MMHGIKRLKNIYNLHSDAFNKLSLGMFIVASPSLFIQVTGL